MTRRQRTPTFATGEMWSYTAGEKGRNRVRLYERHGLVWIDYRTDSGGRVRHSLGHADRDRAKLEADEIAVRFRRAEARPPAALSLQKLFDIYANEVSPGKSRSARDHDGRTLPLLLLAFGPQRRPGTLNIRDWNAYVTRRRRGELTPKGREGKAVRARVVEQDLKLLLAVLNWAERAGDGRGGYLLEKNPLRGLAIPKEENPSRPVLSAEQFTAIRTAATELSSTAELFVCLLWFTGHRAASVRQLRWSDIDLTKRSVLWRAEMDKIQYEHTNPLHSELLPLLERGRAVADLAGQTWIFPAPKDATQPMSRFTAYTLWRSVAAVAGIKTGSRLGTHSCRRAFANRLRNVNLRELKDLGGWKSEKTVVSVYLQPDEDAQRTALEQLTSTGT